MEPYELHIDRGDHDDDFRDTADATRRFYSPTRDRIIAKQLVAAKFGGKNSPYPGDETLIVDKVNATDHPDGIGSIVTYIYTNDRSGGSAFRYRKAPGFLGYRESTVTTRMPAPSARFTQVVVPRMIGIAVSNLVANIWVRVDPIETVPTVNTRHEIEVVVKGWGSAQSKAIASQVNKVHTIQGRSMLFEGGSVTQQVPHDKPTQLEYNVRYSWLADDGTPKYDPSSYDSTFFYLPNIDRKPFHDWVMRDVVGPKLPTASAFSDFFRYDTRPLYATDAQGWRNLPGVPEL